MMMKAKKMLGCMLALLLSVNLISCKKKETAETTESSQIASKTSIVNGHELVTFGQGDRTLTLEKINGKFILGGDIVLNDEQLDDIKISYGSETTPRGARINDATKKWPSGVVDYRFGDNLSETKKDLIRQAIKIWEDQTRVNFRNDRVVNDYVVFTTEDGCHSALGKQGGRQEIATGGCGIPGNLAHEMGHTLGLIHEHQRPDRNNYISIKWDNIQQDWKQWFEIYDANPVTKTTKLDVYSIMCYNPNSKAVAIDPNKPVMTRLNGTTWETNREKLSPGDVAIINGLYNW